jgi:uncharacterized protein DUF6152
MKSKLLIVLAVAVGGFLGAVTVFAHHNAGVAYDLKKKITLTGTVTEYQLINPHALIHFDVKDENGKVSNWVAESEAPQRLYRSGWRKDTLKPGDTITIVGNPARKGKKWIALLTLTTPDGKSLNFNPEEADRY